MAGVTAPSRKPSTHVHRSDPVHMSPLKGPLPAWTPTLPLPSPSLILPPHPPGAPPLLLNAHIWQLPSPLLPPPIWLLPPPLYPSHLAAPPLIWLLWLLPPPPASPPSPPPLAAGPGTGEQEQPQGRTHTPDDPSSLPLTLMAPTPHACPSPSWPLLLMPAPHPDGPCLPLTLMAPAPHACPSPCWPPPLTCPSP